MVEMQGLDIFEALSPPHRAAPAAAAGAAAGAAPAAPALAPAAAAAARGVRSTLRCHPTRSNHAFQRTHTNRERYACRTAPVRG